MIDTKLEDLMAPVSNVDRATHLYARFGWRLRRRADLSAAQSTPLRRRALTPPIGYLDKVLSVLPR
jgi:hypothetical protein